MGFGTLLQIILWPLNKDCDKWINRARLPGLLTVTLLRMTYLLSRLFNLKNCHQSMFPFTYINELIRNKKKCTSTIAISLNLVFMSDCYVIEYLPVNTTLYILQKPYVLVAVSPCRFGQRSSALGVVTVNYCCVWGVVNKLLCGYWTIAKDHGLLTRYI